MCLSGTTARSWIHFVYEKLDCVRFAIIIYFIHGFLKPVLSLFCHVLHLKIFRILYLWKLRTCRPSWAWAREDLCLFLDPVHIYLTVRKLQLSSLILKTLLCKVTSKIHSTVSPSIHYLHLLVLLKVERLLEPIPAVTGPSVGRSLDRLPVYVRADMQTHMPLF